MMSNGDWLKLNRGILKWGWYSDANTMRVFLDILLNANYEDGEYRGHQIKAGQCVVGRKALAKRLCISEQSVRTALEHLKSTNEITIKSTNKFSIATITNWAKYQCRDDEANHQNNHQANQQSTNNQPTTNQQLTTSKKGRREEGKKYIFIPPTVEEVRAYCSERKNNVDPQTFVDFYQGKGWMVGKNKMKDWKAAVRTWERSRKESVQSYKPEPPKYPVFEPEPEVDSVPMPKETEDVLNRLKGMF